MAHYTYEPLSAQDNDFLAWETPCLPMHVGGTQIFEAGALRNEDGGIDFELIKRLTESVLHRIPRYRQKLVWIPGEDRAAWVDDERFNLHYHFRHTSLPRPGTEEQLKRLTAQVMEHNLDRTRPLWETWVVEGLQGDRFALINKIHHCMIDGASGMDLSQILLSHDREARPELAPRFIPRPTPSRTALRVDSLKRRLATPFRAASSVVDYVRRTPDLAGEVTRNVRALGDLVSFTAVRASDTPINGPVGPHRIIDWRSRPLAEFKAIRHAVGCSINDVVLATVTGAVREFMLARQVRLDDLDFRVSSPVNVRREGEHQMGSRVSSWVIGLPLTECDPLKQIQALAEMTRERKASDQAGAVELVTQALQWLPINVSALSKGTINMIVSNVPGPPFPLYLLGAKLERLVPFPPLLEDVGLVVALVSYNGQISWGFNADYDQVTDLAEFASGIDRAFEALADAAGVDLSAVKELSPVAPAKAAELSVVKGWDFSVASASDPSLVEAVDDTMVDGPAAAEAD